MHGSHCQISLNLPYNSPVEGQLICETLKIMVPPNIKFVIQLDILWLKLRLVPFRNILKTMHLGHKFVTVFINMTCGQSATHTVACDEVTHIFVILLRVNCLLLAI